MSQMTRDQAYAILNNLLDNVTAKRQELAMMSAALETLYRPANVSMNVKDLKKDSTSTDKEQKV